MELRRLLCPTDFSAASERALTYAVELLSESGGHVEVLHVFERMSYVAATGQPHTPEGAVRYFERQHAEQRERLQLLSGREGQPEITLGFEACEGIAAEEICRRSGDYDAIVMATHGRTGAARLVFGSVVSRVLPRALCPVWTVPPDDAQQG